MRRPPLKLTPELEQQITADYAAGGVSVALAAQYGCSPVTITKVVRRNGGAIRAPSAVRRTMFSEDQEQQIIAEYLAGARTPALAKKYGCTNPTVGAVLRRNGVATYPAGWRGGRFYTTCGYVLAYVTDDDPLSAMAGPNRRHVPEHRLVMARHLGRPLTATETVHHINGVRDDNRIENLQLRSGHHGAGQAVGCLSCGSHRIGHVPIATTVEWIDWTLVGEAV